MDDTQNERAQFRLMLNATFALYGKPEPDKHVVRMYFETLMRFSLDDVRQGLNLHAIDPDQGQFLPKPADIIRNISGNTATQAQRAWTKVDQAIRHVGPHSSVVFDDPRIHAVISDMGGWILLCGTDDQEYPFKQNEFVKRYTGYANRPIDMSLIPAKLTGISDGNNRREGFEPEPPMLIGDASRAAKVLRLGAEQKRGMITSGATVDSVMS